jgi:hypothetical protein
MTRLTQERVPATGREELGAPDQLVDVRKCGIELNTIRSLIASGELPVRKMGRRTYTKLSCLLALIPDRGTVQAQEPSPANPNSLEAIAARVAGKRGSR